MSAHPQLEKPRTPKRFYFITALIFLPVFYGLTVIQAKWFGWALTAFSFVMLMHMRHTKLWHGLRTVLCFLSAFVVGFCGLYFSRPQWDVSLMGQIGRETVRLYTQLTSPSFSESGDAPGRKATWSPPDGYQWESLPLGLFNADLLRPAEGGATRAVLQLHGGGFESGMNDLYRTFALRYSRMLDGATVLTPDYRLYPAHGYPSQQDDVMTAWRYLTDTLGFSPDQITVVGDSAGGNLTLSLCLRLRDLGEPLPASLVCLSPWADLSNQGPSHISNATVDPTFGVSEKNYGGLPVGVPSTYTASLTAADPYVSPSYGDYAGFPRMLLQAGSIEILLSDSERIRDNAVSHGVDCTLTVYTGMFHVFQGSLDLIPESRDAWSEMEAFLQIP